MALATKCPHCNTIFRVAADQLKLRGGIVRCGSCKEVFDGNAALVDPAAPASHVVRAPVAPAPHPVPPVPPAPPPPPPSTPVPAAPAAPTFEPVQPTLAAAAAADFSLDFDTSLDPFGLLPETAAKGGAAIVADAAPAPVPEPVPASPPPPAPVAPSAAKKIDLELDLDVDFDIEATSAATEKAGPTVASPQPAPAAALFEPFSEPLSEPFFEPRSEPLFDVPAASQPDDDGRREPRFDFTPEEHIVAAALHDAEDTHESAPAPAQAEAETAAPDADIAEQENLDTDIEQAPEEETDEPGFVRQGRRRERMGKTMRIAMAIGSLLLLVALLAQGLTTFRNQLAASVPQMKPLLVSACSFFGCRVEVPAQIDALSIEQGELQTLAENTFSYASILHNQSASAQAWPSIELTLNDAADKPLLRRVLSPRDYLAPTVDLSKGFAPHAEQAVKLYFELAQLKASGYHIAIFYP